jgi:hypothetical protein
MSSKSMTKRLSWELMLGLLMLAAWQRSVAQGVPVKPLCIWFAQPAEKWTDALPIGNGRMGAMVFGGAFDERIQFNEDTRMIIWPKSGSFCLTAKQNRPERSPGILF